MSFCLVTGLSVSQARASDGNEMELCLSLTEAAQVVSDLEERPLLLERINLLESSLKLAKKETMEFRRSIVARSDIEQNLRGIVDLQQDTIVSLEKKVKRSKRGRYFWGTLGFVTGALIVGLATGLTP